MKHEEAFAAFCNSLLKTAEMKLVRKSMIPYDLKYFGNYVKIVIMRA